MSSVYRIEGLFDRTEREGVATLGGHIRSRYTVTLVSRGARAPPIHQSCTKVAG